MGHKKNELFMRYFSPLFPLLRHTVPNILPAADDTKSQAMLPYSPDHRSDQNITEMNISIWWSWHWILIPLFIGEFEIKII